ncbi:MAG: hypothetical protein KatS3mg104_1749 [Phycisphaerae bacterium]|nr:MAG: hypothetical protein KatS3mg104_1749 [Phycisphaerae bacterium]
MLTEAITANPADPLSWLERARFRRAVAPSFTTDVNAISSDYFQSVSRNPTDVEDKNRVRRLSLAGGQKHRSKDRIRKSDETEPDASGRRTEKTSTGRNRRNPSPTQVMKSSVIEPTDLVSRRFLRWDTPKKFLRLDRELHGKFSENFLTETTDDHVDGVF